MWRDTFTSVGSGFHTFETTLSRQQFLRRGAQGCSKRSDYLASSKLSDSVER
jgi:hypothetical protein